MKKNLVISIFVFVNIFTLMNRSIMAQDEYLTITATASSTYNNYPSYAPARIVDGNLNTYWLGQPNQSPWWIMLDAGELKNMASVTLHWYSAYYTPTDYDLQISTDNSTWENIITRDHAVYSPNGQRIDIGRNARYIKLVIREPRYFAVIKEIQAMGSDAVNLPLTIRFEGVLKDSSGALLNNPATLTFRLYDVETSGTLLWQETQPGIAIENGKFDVELGSVTPLDLAFDKQYWLSVEVESDGEMSPRFKLTSVPYAFSSKD